MRALDLLEAVEERHDLLARLVGELVELTVTTTGSGFPVHVDPSQLDQLLLNLVANARDAMPGGGSLVLDVTNVVLKAHEADELGLPVDDWVRVEVRDTGEGIPDAVMAKVLDPFFTTKETGTGLGLSTCYGMVQRHGGAIALSSEPGEGTRVSVYLPRFGG